MASQASLGQMSQAYCLSEGYMVGGMITGLAFPVILALRRRDEATDYFVGTAGQAGTCAAQGLPAVASVETEATATKI
jgi:hypothetical protein